jgi:hypothetical protein
MIESLLAPPATAQRALGSPHGFLTDTVGTMPSNTVIASNEAGSAVERALEMLALAGAHIRIVMAGVRNDWRLEATNVLNQLAAQGELPGERLTLASRVFALLRLWEVNPPTEVGDASDDDFSLVWRNGGLVASLVVNADKVLGYAYRPGMREPWVFAQPGIELADLNAFARQVGSARAEGLGRP